MRRRYQAQLLKPFGKHLRVVAVRNLSTAERAVRQCEAWLESHPVVTTRFYYHRDTGRAFISRVADLKKSPDGKILARKAYPDGRGYRLEAPVTVVASVGELGWTP